MSIEVSQASPSTVGASISNFPSSFGVTGALGVSISNAYLGVTFTGVSMLNFPASFGVSVGNIAFGVSGLVGITGTQLNTISSNQLSGNQLVQVVSNVLPSDMSSVLPNAIGAINGAISVITQGTGTAIFLASTIGGFSGTLVTEASINGATWVLANFQIPNQSGGASNTIISLPQAGVFSCGGYQSFRLRCSSYNAGTAIITINAGPGQYYSRVYSDAILGLGVNVSNTSLGITGTGIGVTFPTSLGTIGITGTVGITSGGLGVTFGAVSACLGTTLGKTFFFQGSLKAVTGSTAAIFGATFNVSSTSNSIWLSGYSVDGDNTTPLATAGNLGVVSLQNPIGTNISFHRMTFQTVGSGDRVIMVFPEPICLGGSGCAISIVPGTTGLMTFATNMWGYAK